MDRIPAVGEKVIAYKSETDTFHEVEVTRVYDEDIYEAEHYPLGDVPDFMARNDNLPLVDVRFPNALSDSKAHFVWGLRELPEGRRLF